MKRLILGGFVVLLMQVVSIAKVNAQSSPTAPTPQLPRGTGNYINYPPGTQIYQNGAIQTPGGSVIYPNVAVPKGDGSTTYYYQDGTRINTQRGGFATGGTYLTPGTVNGGVGNSSTPPSTETFFIPGGLGRQPNNR
ncbi:MAG: hypothetical protein WCA35_10880 [Kovacikia sp.]